MRVNHNIASMNALRSLNNTIEDSNKNLKSLSSGLRVNSAADGPADLMISEHMRSQISGINQAVKNSETSISMVQTAEGVLSEMSSMLISMRQLALHAANDGAADENMLQADQIEIENILSTMDRIATSTNFGTKVLFDGSNEVSGVTTGEGLSFYAASPLSRPAPTKQGYAINIEQASTRSEVIADKVISLDDIEKGVTFVINENNRVLKMETNQDINLKENIQTLVNAYRRSPETFSKFETEKRLSGLISRALNQKAEESGLDIGSQINDSGRMIIKHNEFGSRPSFSVSTNVNGLFGEDAGLIKISSGGKDVSGYIGGHLGIGEGHLLHGAQGTPTEGIIVQYNKEPEHRLVSIRDKKGRIIGQKLVRQTNKELVGKEVEGYVHITQNSVVYHIGPNHEQTVSFSLDDLRSERIARDVENNSEFKSLADIDLTNSDSAQDSIKLIDKALDEIGELRGNLGAFQKNTLESNLRNLRISNENLTSAESVIRDSDMAAEMSDFTKNQILVASGTAMAAQANQIPKSVMQLLVNSTS